MTIQPQISPSDRALMQQCIQLARRALGRTSPNPLVGAVIVRDGEAIAQGFHPSAGQPHAEVFALSKAGELARGATIYVNLEPCNHHGRTPPCSEALIAAGIEKVVVGMVDPDPRVSGGGIERLRQAGIEVVVGVEEEACRHLNEAFIHRILARRPLGVLKYAMTLDGKIAATTGHSAWITGAESRHLVHHQRGASDAVIVGGNTVRCDNPQLTTHRVTDRNPLRVVMSRTLDLPPEANLWQTKEAPTLVLTEVGVNPSFQDKLRDRGVEVVELPTVNPAAALACLYNRGCSQVFWECGGTLAAKAIAQGTVQKVMAFIAPKIIGGREAPSPVANLGLTKMTQALQLEQVTMRAVGPDFLIEGYLPKIG